jgi:hypothetical protein
MSAKRDDSLLSLGYTTIGSDKPTKAKLQAAAKAQGLTLSEYIRMLADKVTTDKQGTLYGVQTATLPGIASMLKSVMVKLDSYVDKNSYSLAEIRSVLDNFIGATDKSYLDEAIEALRSIKAKHDSQLSMGLSENEG